MVGKCGSEPMGSSTSWYRSAAHPKLDPARVLTRPSDDDSTFHVTETPALTIWSSVTSPSPPFFFHKTLSIWTSDVEYLSLILLPQQLFSLLLSHCSYCFDHFVQSVLSLIEVSGVVCPQSSHVSLADKSLSATNWLIAIMLWGANRSCKVQIRF